MRRMRDSFKLAGDTNTLTLFDRLAGLSRQIGALENTAEDSAPLDAKLQEKRIQLANTYDQTERELSSLVLKQASREPDRPGNCFSIFFDLIRI
jgi:hypothetical protein